LRFGVDVPCLVQGEKEAYTKGPSTCEAIGIHIVQMDGARINAAKRTMKMVLKS